MDVDVSANVYLHVHVHVYCSSHRACEHACVYAWANGCIDTFCVLMDAWMGVCIACMHACTLHVCVHVSLYVCMHLHIHI